jgi:hypothetical protein
MRSDLLRALDNVRAGGIISSPHVNQDSTEIYVPPGMEHMAKVGPLRKLAVLREAPEGAPLLALGSLENYTGVRPRTQLEVSEISPVVAVQCGEPCQHEPPANIGKPTVEARKLKELTGLSQIAPDILLLAKTDRKQELEALILASDPPVSDMFRPLNEVDTCSGLPGVSGVNRLNLSTAPGYPMTGNKRGLVEDAELEHRPEAIKLTQEQRDEIVRVRGKLRTLERVNFVFKCSHKDEAVTIGKQKVRIFEGSQFAMTFLIRMYFLPIMRVYFMFQLRTGSAVGINAAGAEWHQLAEWLMAYNPDHVIEGDWVHFDTSQAYQEVMTVLSLWIELAIKYGTYSQGDINMMWVLAEELACHYAIFRGDLGMVVGTNASGNGITVFINNEDNVLRNTCSFYALAPKDHTPPRKYLLEGVSPAGIVLAANSRSTFKPLLPHLHGRFYDYARITTYGDDFLMTVHPETLSWFNQYTISAWFATQGKMMTDSSKGPFMRPATPWAEASFLKRGFRMDAETGHYMAPLKLKSIYKPLHIWPKVLTTSRQAHAAQLLDGAIRELFLHGRDVFERRVPDLMRVAETYGCASYVRTSTSYDDLFAEWMAYEPSPFKSC